MGKKRCGVASETLIPGDDHHRKVHNLPAVEHHQNSRVGITISNNYNNHIICPSIETYRERHSLCCCYKHH